MRRQPYTLIEVIIVVALVAILAGMGGVNIVRSVRQERLRAATEVVLAQLQLAQELMLLHDGDVVVEVRLDDQRMTCCLKTELQLPSSMRPSLCRTETGVERIVFYATDGRQLSDRFSLDFFSGGSVMSGGTIVLEAYGERREITLTGTPAPIRLGEQSEELELPDGEALYPQQEALPVT